MSSITIQNIIDTYNARDAQRILRSAITQATHGLDDRWVEVCDAAKRSPLVNTDHPNSRKIKWVTPSQILDRMNTDALTIMLKLCNSNGAEDALIALDAIFNGAIKNAYKVTYWPFSVGTSYDFDAARAQDISHLLDNADNDHTPAQDADDAGFDDEMLNIANMAAAKATGGKVSDIGELFKELTELRARPATAAPTPVQASGDIPAGKPVRMNAQDVFNLRDKLLDFEITAYNWDGDNPLVPSIMGSFRFDVDALADLLWAREKNKNAWLVGHTGTGKSTLVEQVCAYTRTMFQRVNFDSDITRLEFVGKVDVTTDDDGSQVTSFTDGILPTAMQTPCVLMLDEADAIRGDIAYVLQPVLEGKSLRLLEDGGRVVQPHPEFTIVATANTVGSGDSTGMYSAAVKMQSRAAMNRYNVFINVDYMPVDEEMNVIAQVVPSMSNVVANHLSEFITHYRNAVKTGQVETPISPRNTITIAQYANDFEERIGTNAAFKRALERNLFNSMDEGERAIAVGIADRITA